MPSPFGPPSADTASPAPALATSDQTGADTLDATSAEHRADRVARSLQTALVAILEPLAGRPPRPVRLTRSAPGPGLDKSLASRLVQASVCEPGTPFLHRVPSPTGLRMLLEAARPVVDQDLIAQASQAIEQFAQLLDSLPGGRQGLDALIGESQGGLREQREQAARQASFKAVSFLFGHYCETLATALFVVPSALAGHVDVIEVHRRIGLRRLTASAQLPLLSVYTGAHQVGSAQMVSLCASPAGTNAEAAAPLDAANFVIAEASSRPLPPIEVHREGALATFLLAAGRVDMQPLTITTAYRLRCAERIEQIKPYSLLRAYMLHTPCRHLVRDVYLADGLWPDAFPEVAHYLPSPSGAPAIDLDPALPHFRRVNLTTRIEQRPRGGAGFALSAASDHADTLTSIAHQAGLDPQALRSWRCEMPYPVPLIEMNLAFRFASAA